MVIGIYDWVLAWDHAQGRAWIVSHGGEGSARGREQRAERRLEAVLKSLRVGEDVAPRPQPVSQMHMAARAYPVPGVAGVLSNFSREAYLAAVERVIEYIRAGDIFQANLSQRLAAPALCTPLELYGRLRRRNPAPFAGYFAHGDWAVLSASPERFLRLEQGLVETRPIKGTRQRRPVPEADLFSRDELRESAKEQAENIMIVDLLRNDLSKVCRAGSIEVSQLCAVETYETVQHLVSEVRGELARGRDFWDLLQATFPGGSITGAPKVRAMEIITELEQVARGPYCGSLFWCGFDDDADSNILIRTFLQKGGWVHFPVGGGVVAASDPEAEYAETLHKAEGMLLALRVES
jgi:para-aminobenzoate synthetase component 1